MGTGELSGGKALKTPMHADVRRSALDSITEQVIKCAHAVQNTLGVGFLEKVYENALMVEIAEAGLRARQQSPIGVRYRGRVVGDYLADILVEEQVVVEIKACTALSVVHRVQCLNYLKATGLSVALLFNFGTSRLEIKRIVERF
jgi:GxxExxY protein